MAGEDGGGQAGSGVGAAGEGGSGAAGLGGAGTGGAAGLGGPSGEAGAAGVSISCGDGLLGANEECDLGAVPPSSSAEFPCSPSCRITDIPLPVFAGQGTSGQQLGLGRHTLATSPTGALSVLIVPSQDEALIAAARFDAKGVFLGALDDLADGGGSDLWGHPVASSLGDAGFAVAWTDRFLDGDQLAVGLRKVAPDGSLSASPVVANQSQAFAQQQPDLAWTGSELVVAWIDQSDPFTAPDLKLRRFSSDLVPLGDEQFLAATDAAESAPVLAPLGTSWAAAWRAVLDGQETLRIETAEGVSWSLGPFPASPAEERPALVALDATHLLLAFSLASDEGSPPSLRLAVLDVTAPSANVDLVPFGIMGGPPGTTFPALASSDDGLFLAWRAGNAPGDPLGQDLWLRPLSWEPATGQLGLGGSDVPFPRLQAHRQGDQRWPTLALLPGAAPALVLAWQDLGSGVFSDQNFSRVFVQFAPLPFTRLDAGGSPEDTLASCTNGLDDDADGQTDCNDMACAAFCETTVATCTDGLDNDNDGKVDCAEISCALLPDLICPELAGTPACENGIDDDKDGLIDLADISCLFQ